MVETKFSSKLKTNAGHENKYIFFMFPELFYTHFLTRGPLNQISRKFIKVRNGISRNVEINWTKL